MPEKTGAAKVVIMPKLQALPVALTAQTANILQCNTMELHQAINELVLSNPVVEPMDGEDFGDYAASIPARGETLSEHLSSQLRIAVRDRTILRTALVIVNSLDKNGYLREDEAELRGICRCSCEQFDAALQQVQALEPTGVGARSLAECLSLQLLAMEEPNELALHIVRGHLEALALGRLCLPDYSDEEVGNAVTLILSLDPRPGGAFDTAPTIFVMPDISVSREDEGFAVSLINQPRIPALNNDYAAIVKQADETERQYLRENLARVKGFLYAVEQRRSTLLNVAAYAVEVQSEYLRSGKAAYLQKLTLSDAAGALGLSVSTVSRAVNDKYMEYEKKLMPLRSLFTSGGCGEVTRHLIEERIRCICAESQCPLSDSAVAKRLEEEGIKISRRTVNKYRSAMEKRRGSI